MFENLSFRFWKISFSSWISMTSSFKKTEVKLEYDMLLMVEKGIIEEEYFTLFINMQKLITNT